MPPKPETVRDRHRQRYRAGPILERSGDLASRILADWDDTSAVAGTNVVYAATHHFGDPRRGVPARPFLGVSADARDAVLQATVDHLSSDLRDLPRSEARVPMATPKTTGPAAGTGPRCSSRSTARTSTPSRL